MTLFITEPIVAVLVSIVGSFFDVFKRLTYIPTPVYQPDWHVIFWFCVWAFLSAYYLVVTILRISTKENESFISKTLQNMLDVEKTAKESVVVQRNLLVKITAFARQLVTKKSDRLASIIASDPLTVSSFLSQLNPSLQVGLLLRIIHEFFKPSDVNSILRLALWMKANPEDDFLSPVYSWNGEKGDCFTHKSKERMRLSDPLGARSEVVKVYHTNADSLKIIPNCEQASRNGEFQYFNPEQAEKVRSMMLYKHVFMRQQQPIAVVLMLVSSQADQFQLGQKEDIKQFLEEMLMRVEMEWIVLELTSKLK